MSPQAATTILDDEGRVLGTCNGPDAGGNCSRTADDGTVPCAGHVLRTESSGRAGWELRVHPVVAGCPLAARRAWAKQPGRRWGPVATTT